MELTPNMSENDRKTKLQEFDDMKAGVKGLVEGGLQKIPSVFIDHQFIEESKLPSTKSEFSIPLIDLECLQDDRCGIVERVKYACEEWGFFQIINHGIPTSLTKEVFEGVRKFHELDKEMKKHYYSRDYTKKVIYNSNFDLHQASTTNWRDTLYMNMAPDPPQPQELPAVCRYTHFKTIDSIQKILKYLILIYSLQ